jgi:hypothetical protein
MGAFKVTIPVGYTATALSISMTGTGNSTRSELEINGALELAGDCTANAYNRFSGSGTIDLQGNDIIFTQTETASNKYNIFELVGAPGAYAKIIDTVGGGRIRGSTETTTARGLLTLNYVSLIGIYFRFGGSYYGGTPIDVQHVVFKDMVYTAIGFYHHRDDDLTLKYIDFVGSDSTTVESSLTVVAEIRTQNGDTHSSLGTTDVGFWTFSMPGVSPAPKIRLLYAEFYDIDTVVAVACLIERSSGTPVQEIQNALFVLDTSGGVIATGTGCEVTDSYMFCRADNPHTYLGGDLTDSVIEAVYSLGATDAGDHCIVPSTIDFTVSGSLIIDGLGGVLLNALGASRTQNYAAIHNTCVVDITTVGIGVPYGTLARNESGGSFGGTLTLLSNIAYVRSNISGSTAVRAINMETAGDDQVTTMDNNAYFGYSATLGTRLYQVTSATKTYGDADWGAGDITGVDPEFVDDSRGLAGWQATQNGGGDTDDAINFALLINGYDSSSDEQLVANESGFDVSEVIAWVKGGYAPTNAAYDSTAHDGGTPGAVAFLSSGGSIDTIDDPILDGETGNELTRTGDEITSLTIDGVACTNVVDTAGTVTFDVIDISAVSDEAGTSVPDFGTVAVEANGDSEYSTTTDLNAKSGYSVVTMASIDTDDDNGLYKLCRRSEEGAHTGSDDASVLTDSGQSWTPDEHIGKTVFNFTDGSEGLITDNDATTITATLSGGTGDDWDTDDEYGIGHPLDDGWEVYFPTGDNTDVTAAGLMSSDLSSVSFVVINRNSGDLAYPIDWVILSDEPVMPADTTASPNENQTTVGTYAASSGDSITYTLSGTDSAFFSINSSSGAVTFQSAPDYEDPQDADAGNDYEITVTATNSFGSDSQNITINVQDVADVPVMPADTTASPDENQTAVGTYIADSGSATITYSLSGADASLFDINPSTAVVTFADAPNYENPLDADGDNDYEITVVATNAFGSDSQNITVSVQDINESPIMGNQTFNALDGALAGEAEFQVAASDPEDDTLTFAITAGNTGTDWGIDPDTGILTNLNTLDAGTTAQYNLTVTADEATNDPTGSTITINVITEGGALMFSRSIIKPFSRGLI